MDLGLWGLVWGLVWVRALELVQGWVLAQELAQGWVLALGSVQARVMGRLEGCNPLGNLSGSTR